MPSFPSSPTLNQKYTTGGRSWNWNGTVWELVQGPIPHKSSHATGGSDALVAADIGAASTSHKSTHATGGTDALTAADIGAASLVHKSRHATGGADALTPADIGALSANSPTFGTGAVTIPNLVVSTQLTSFGAVFSNATHVGSKTGAWYPSTSDGRYQYAILTTNGAATDPRLTELFLPATPQDGARFTFVLQSNNGCYAKLLRTTGGANIAYNVDRTTPTPGPTYGIRYHIVDCVYVNVYPPLTPLSASTNLWCVTITDLPTVL